MSLSPGDPMILPVTAVIFAVAAGWVDLRERRIPNRLVIAGILVGLVAQVWLNGLAGLAAGLGGLVIGLLLMLPFYALRAMGAGDAKLMAMIGGFLGPSGVLAAAVLTFLIGGVLSLVVATANGTLGRMLWNVRAMLFGAFATIVVQRKAEIGAPAVSAGRLPYGIAIALGTLLYAVLLHSGIRIF